KQTALKVSLDLEEAFNTICHEGLLLKKEDSGFPARILKTIKSHLRNTRFLNVKNDSGSLGGCMKLHLHRASEF
ncbi:hypothetical protein Trydic_g10559, partial [Trypoxylus dichotomus]